MLICIGLCGCSNQSKLDVTPIAKGFECDFSITDSSVSGEMSVNIEGDLSFIFSGPDIINTLSIRIKEQSVILEVQGISERYKREEVPKDSPLLLIYDALLSMPTDELDVTVSDSKTIVSGNNANGNYKATLDGTGHITEISFSKSDTVIQFSNHIDIKNTESYARCFNII